MKNNVMTLDLSLDIRVCVVHACILYKNANCCTIRRNFVVLYVERHHV